ncbi:stage III sporulation protein AG [Evansella sp. AB-P1]|uniref:stage III sporulation protein AG n=1 Tax=Evansella sp. AB-P1 TaxID=3037653 RepID=UPI00241DA0BC|nr:stage III sporulation protein AG [Evansella sp. AB-P1]MDG5788696.1 stage III sporulation protein AG [Evansella sp. AB-P1]
MADNKQDSSWFKSFTMKSSGKKLNIKYLFLLLLIGVFFMIIGNVLQSDDEPSSTIPVLSEEEEEPASEVFMSDDKPEEISSMSEYESFYERQLERALEQVVGVSDVTVVVNLAETERVVYQKNQNIKEQITDETDREGGTREVQDKTKDEQVVIIRNGDREEALVVKTEKPDIRGVLVVANGVENIQVKTWIVEAVSRVLDVPSHRVSVLPKKSKGE